MRTKILLVTLLIAAAAFGIVKWNAHVKAKKLATVQAEYDKLDLGHDEGGMFDEDKVAKLVDWFGEHHIAMRRGYYLGQDVANSLYSCASHDIEGDFWRGCGNAEIAACRGVKFEWGKHGITLPIEDFDGKDPDWWLALRLSKLNATTTDHAYAAWQTEEAVSCEVVMAQEDPAYYLAHSEKSGSCRLDPETVSKTLENMLAFKFVDEAATIDREATITKESHVERESDDRVRDLLRVDRADLAELKSHDWLTEYRQGDRKFSAHEFHVQRDLKVKDLEALIRCRVARLEGAITRDDIAKDVDARIAAGKARQALLDKVKKELKARLYARTK